MQIQEQEWLSVFLSLYPSGAQCGIDNVLCNPHSCLNKKGLKIKWNKSFFPVCSGKRLLLPDCSCLALKWCSSTVSFYILICEQHERGVCANSVLRAINVKPRKLRDASPLNHGDFTPPPWHREQATPAGRTKSWILLLSHVHVQSNFQQNLNI